MAIDDWEGRLITEASDRAVAESVADAVRTLFAIDSDLLIRNVNERTITSQLAVHLRPRFEGWQVDCEYNRDSHFVKKTGGIIVVPDVIVHHRGTPDNLLVNEVKKSNSRVHDEEDLQKLVAFR